MKGYYLQFDEYKNITIDNPVKEGEYYIERIDDLVPGTKYMFMIAARTSKGFGKSYRLPNTFITPPQGMVFLYYS